MKSLITSLINIVLLLATMLALGIGWALTVQVAQLHIYAGLLVPVLVIIVWLKFVLLPMLRWRTAVQFISTDTQPGTAMFAELAHGQGLHGESKTAENLQDAYKRVALDAEKMITTAAETIFYHTAISQAGQLDSLVLWRSHWQLTNQIYAQYSPASNRSRLALYAYLLQVLLMPNRKDDLNLTAQIGPALVGASIVGAIPGANLVSIIISDAVVQGSANALASLRVGLLVQRFFLRQVETESWLVDEDLRAINKQATELLMPLVSNASSVLSRMIWNAARDHIKRIPSATLAGLKTMVTKSLKGIGGVFADKSGSAIDDLLPPHEDE